MQKPQLTLADANTRLDVLFKSALGEAALSKKLRDSIIRTKPWATAFSHVGDLFSYLMRFTDDNSHNSQDVYKELTAAGCPTFESIVRELEATFDCTTLPLWTPGDLTAGEAYSAFQIGNFAGIQNAQQGIFPVRPQTSMATSGVLLQATIEGGAYPNEWIDGGQAFRYYLFGRKAPGTSAKKFDLTYALNRAVIESPNAYPLCLFEKQITGGYRYFGRVKLVEVIIDDSGSWFRLQPQDVSIPTQESFERSLQAAVLRSAAEDEGRARRLADSPTLPGKKLVLATTFDRNADVIAAVLKRASGSCEGCGKKAPFARPDGRPFLEVHHVIPLAQKGTDTVRNAVAVCPNCHKFAHYGRPEEMTALHFNFRMAVNGFN